jgi:hypothetical protein
MAALQSLLSPQVLTQVISQKAAASDWLLTLFGCQPGGPNERNEGHGRYGAFNVYNNVRSVAKGRAPGTAAGRSAVNPVGTVPFTYPRMHDSISMPAEVLHNLGLIANPAMRDSAGADYIKRQTGTLAQKAANWRKAMLVGMLRDSLYLQNDGENQVISYTSGMRMNFQMPAGNKGQLNMLGAGNIIDVLWSTLTANVPDHLLSINAAFQKLNGGHLSAVICGWKVWNFVKKNQYVQEDHGTSHSPFLRFERLAMEETITKTGKNVMIAELASAPGVVFYITDEGLDIGPEGAEVYTKIVDDGYAIFLGFEPGADVIACYLGSEPIAEYENGPEEVKTGVASWSVKRSNPTCTDVLVLDNCLTVNHVFDSVCYAQVF